MNKVEILEVKVKDFWVENLWNFWNTIKIKIKIMICVNFGSKNVIRKIIVKRLNKIVN